MNHLDCKLGWMKQQARIFASDSAWVTTAANVPSLKAWYRADTTVNGGGTVSQLTDKSGNGFHLTQATGTKQPALNVADANMGGRDSITFDGVDDVLTMASPGYGTMNGATLLFATRSLVAGSALRIFVIGPDTARSVNIRNTASAGFPQGGYTNVSTTARNVDTVATTFAAAVPTVWGCSFNTQASPQTGALITRSRLGAPVTTNVATGATPATINVQPVSLGSNTSVAGFSAFVVSEVIVCSQALTAEQMRKIELYLAGYYGLL